MGWSYSTQRGDNKLDIKEVGWGGVDWIRLAQDAVQWRALFNTRMKLLFV
jgi:hypothetical protein